MTTKKDLVFIFKESLQKIKRSFYLLSLAVVLIMIVGGAIIFNSRKTELTKFIKYNLNYDQILPGEESKFINGLQSATRNFSYNIVQPESKIKNNVVCSRNNCFSLNFNPLLVNIFLPVLGATFLIGLFIFFLEFLQKRKLLTFLQELSLLQKALGGEKINLAEISSHELLSLMENLDRNKKHETQKIEIELKSNINRQIAHDIRSPLEALRSVTTHINDLDHTSKQIINNSIGRITDIANGLLKSTKQQDSTEFNEGNLRILIDDIINDKKFEHNIRIHYLSTVDYKDTFINGNENNLYRSISNLVNNAYESQDPSKVRIEINLDKSESGIILKIRDFGEGMSEELMEKALSGGTTTKEKGNGLGVSFSKDTIEKHNGTFLIESIIGEGTSITICLPTISTPDWFTDQILISKSISEVICVDDDPSFLELYKEKLKNIEKTVLIYSEKKLDEIKLSESSQFYFDYDLGNGKTGLDFIINHNLSSQSTLVTSMHQDEEIQDRCIEHGIKILPKQVFNNAKVIVLNEVVDDAKEKLNQADKIVFIDDDYLMHMSWKMEADKKDINLDCYHTIDEFVDKASEYDLKTKIFIDSNLKDGIKGEIESEKIAKLGFTELFLSTGYSPSDIDKPEWIKAVVGKRANF